MVDGIEGYEPEALRNLVESRTRPLEKSEESVQTGKEVDSKAAEVNSNLINLSKGADEIDIVRVERVNEVRAKLENGELLSEESIQGAARRLAENGGG